MRSMSWLLVRASLTNPDSCWASVKCTGPQDVVRTVVFKILTHTLNISQTFTWPQAPNYTMLLLLWSHTALKHLKRIITVNWFSLG